MKGISPMQMLVAAALMYKATNKYKMTTTHGMRYYHRPSIKGLRKHAAEVRATKKHQRYREFHRLHG